MTKVNETLASKLATKLCDENDGLGYELTYNFLVAQGDLRVAIVDGSIDAIIDAAILAGYGVSDDQVNAIVDSILSDKPAEVIIDGKVVTSTDEALDTNIPSKADYVAYAVGKALRRAGIATGSGTKTAVVRGLIPATKAVSNKVIVPASKWVATDGKDATVKAAKATGRAAKKLNRATTSARRSFWNGLKG